MNASDLSKNSKWTSYLMYLAERRVEELGLSDEQTEFLLADWPEGNEHLSWLILAPIEDILDWGEMAGWGREDA